MYPKSIYVFFIIKDEQCDLETLTAMLDSEDETNNQEDGVGLFDSSGIWLCWKYLSFIVKLWLI